MYYLLFLIPIAFSSISPADYISQSDRPKIAAHRGLCSIFPENTAQSFEGAMFQGTDFIELDVVLNKELQLIVAHDTFMTAVSNIKSMPEFASRQRKRTINGVVRDDWWLIDFSVDELKRVGINQVRGSTRPKMFDGLFTYPTLWEVLTQVKDFNNRTANQRNPNKKPVGILLEIKDYEYHLEYAGVSIVQLVINELSKFGIGTIKDCKNVVPIVIMSFDMNAIKATRELTDLPRVFLMSGLQNQPSAFYAEATKYANIIGADLASVWNQKTQTIQPEVKLIKDNQMMVYAWTFQDDASGTQKMFNATIAKDIYYQAVKMNIHGLITEFSDVAIYGFKIQEKIYTWGRFLLFFLTGLILLIVSFPFSGFLLVNPYPFVLLFSLGSLLILIAIIQVTEYKTIFSQAGTVIYFIALLSGLYTGVFKIGYLTTLGIMIVQILALLYLMAALLPGGQAGLKNYILSKIKT